MSDLHPKTFERLSGFFLFVGRLGPVRSRKELLLLAFLMQKTKKIVGNLIFSVKTDSGLIFFRNFVPEDLKCRLMDQYIPQDQLRDCPNGRAGTGHT